MASCLQALESVNFSFCLFCYKSENNVDRKEKSSGNVDVNRFILLVQRYFGIPVNLNEFLTSNSEAREDVQLKVNPCETCLHLLDCFCELYHELKCAELKIQWKVSTLLEIMREAGKCTSRKKLLKTALGKEYFRRIAKDREEWIQTCSERLRQCFPTVILQNQSLTYQPSNGDTTQTADFKLAANSSCNLEHLDCDVELEGDKEIITGDYAKKCVTTKIENHEVSKEKPVQNENVCDWDQGDENLGSPCASIADYDEQVPMADEEGISENQPEQQIVMSSNETAGKRLEDHVITIKCETEIVQATIENYDKVEERGVKDNHPVSSDENPKEPKQRVQNQILKSSKVRKVAKRLSQSRFPCNICKGTKIFPNYNALQIHKKFLYHRLRLQSMKLGGNRSVKPDDQVSVNHDSSSPAPPTSTSKEDLSHQTHFKLESSPTKRSAGCETLYNLRKRSKKPVKNEEDGSEPELSADEDYKNDDEDSSSISSNEASDDAADMPDIKTSYNKKRRVAFACKHRGCIFVSRKQRTRDSHMKVHEPGRFQCSFCKKVTRTALDLSIHELKHGGKVGSSHLYKCSRCPYETLRRLRYIHHFVKDHLNLPEMMAQACPVCHVEAVNQETHFKRYHETKGMDKEKILHCPEDNCDAAFTKLRYLRRHRSEFHSLRRLNSYESDSEDDTTNDPCQCRHCGRKFTSEVLLRKHKYIYHNKNTPQKLGEVTKSVVCPNTKCTERVYSQTELELHLKLHGTFKCAGCTFQTEFVPELMKHEVECRQLKSSQGRFKCPDCNFVSKFLPDLIDHRLESHLCVSRNIFKCDVCSLSSRTRSCLNIHKIKFHGDGLDPEKSQCCLKCPAYFKHKHQLEDHLKSCTGSRDPQRLNYCEMCKEQFSSDKEFEIHSTYHGKWTCQFCPVEENFAPDLAIHENDIHSSQTTEDNKLHCSRCEWSGRSNEKLRGNYMKHFVSKHLGLNTKIYKCHICHAGFFNKNTRWQHHEAHHGVIGSEGSFKCDECPAYFKERVQLLLHKRQTHKQLTDLTCTVCGKVLKNETTLKNHIRTQHPSELGGPGFICDRANCGVWCANQDDLHYHQKRKCALIAKLNKLVICSVCGKSCKGQWGLKIHMKKHNPDRPSRPTEWKCAICSKSFKTKLDLKQHEKWHKDPAEWQFMCAVCSKKCVNKYKLEEHMRTHTKEKPFVCQVCGEKYAHKHNLQNHIKSKHKEIKLEMKKHVQRFCVSRKGKKLGTNFCFTKAKDMGEDSEDSSGSSD